MTAYYHYERGCLWLKYGKGNWRMWTNYIDGAQRAGETARAYLRNRGYLPQEI